MNIQNNIIKLVIGVIVFIAVYILLLMLITNFGITKEQIKNYVDGFGAFGIIFLFIIMALSVMSPFPDSPAAIAAIFLYGSVFGGVIILFGSLLGAVLDFLIIRKLGRKYFYKHAPYVMENVNRIAKKFGFEAMVFFRIFPTVTFDIASYAAALTKVKLYLFILASFIGLFPLALTYSIIGIGLESDNMKVLISSISLGILFLSVVIFISRYFGKKLKLNELEDDIIK
ncbi:MAG: VTT domain-containing protein [bacterium]